MINNFLLKDVELIHFLLVHNESLTSGQSNYFLTVALCHRENLIMLSSIIFFQINWQYYFFPRFKRVTVEELDLILPSNNERIDWRHVHCYSSFEVFFGYHGHFEVVIIFFSIKFKRLLIYLVSDGILHFGSNHDLATSHVIELNILEFGSQGLPIDQIVIYFVQSYNLNPHVTIHVIDCVLADSYKALVHLELSIVCFNAMLNFEKQDVTRATYHKCFVEN